jgi:hypothetical protein
LASEKSANDGQGQVADKVGRRQPPRLRVAQFERGLHVWQDQRIAKSGKTQGAQHRQRADGQNNPTIVQAA